MLPPSLRTVPNPPIAGLSDEHLTEELAYWDDIVANSKSWGSALVQAKKFGDACRNEMNRRQRR